MPPRGVTKGSKRARQYEHIKDSLQERGSSTDEAEEIAARTVNKERARSGEATTSSRLSREDISSGRRGGIRSHRSSPRGRTREQLYEEAKDRKIRGRSKMTKAELERARDLLSVTGWPPIGVIAYQGSTVRKGRRDRFGRHPRARYSNRKTERSA